jgi:hypothetical protein
VPSVSLLTLQVAEGVVAEPEVVAATATRLPPLDAPSAGASDNPPIGFLGWCRHASRDEWPVHRSSRSGQSLAPLW